MGGGIAGLFAAYYLEKEGASVTLFEKGEPGGDSIHAAGILEPENFYRINNLDYLRRAWRYWRNDSSAFHNVDRRWLFRYFRTMGREPDRAGWTHLRAMAEESTRAYNALAEARNDFELRMGGLEEVYESAKAFRAAVRANESKYPPVPFEVKERKGLAGVIYFPKMGWLHTELFVRRILSEMPRVRIERKAVRSLSADGTLDAGGGPRRFDAVVASTGVAARRIGLPLTAVKGYGWHAIARERKDIAVIYADRGIAAVPLGPRAGTPSEAGRHLKVTGGWDFDLTERTTHAEAILSRARELAGLDQVLDFRSGQRPCSPDGLPIVSRSGNVVAVAGGFRLGWSYAPGMGREGALLALGKKQNDPFLSRYSNHLRAGPWSLL